MQCAPALEAGSPIAKDETSRMSPASEAIPHRSLSRLHPQFIDGSSEIRDLLDRARREQVELDGRLNLGLTRQRAFIQEMDATGMLLQTHDFDAEQPHQIFLNLALDDRLYFLSVEQLAHDPATGRLRVGLPSVVFYAERRDRPRRPPSEDASDPTRVALRDLEGRIPDATAEAWIEDLSEDGLRLRVAESVLQALPSRLRLSFLDGARAGQQLFGAVRYRSPGSDPRGWRRIGLSTSAAPSGPPLPVERRDAILPASRMASAQHRWKLLGAGARMAVGRALQRVTGRPPALPEIEIIELRDERGEHLKGIVDACGEVRGAPLVLIPPAWAKTKETLLPLARTIVESFRNAGESVAVVRLDGIRRRGESYNDASCAAPGRECHHMTFSQGAADIRTAIEHFAASDRFQPSAIVLVTFSGAAIEARHALAEKCDARVGGWVSVVGAADLKSGLRTVSGGVDYIGGFERDVRFGIQRILGIEVDMDRVAEDAIRHRMAYLEDARCEMAKLELPITWIQGRFDAWINPERVQEILSCGDASRRRLVEVPTGHQLRNSREALQTFQLISQEIGRIVLGREIPPSLPDLGELEQRRRAERARLPKTTIDLKGFWRDYLLGRDRRLGMELLTVSSPYRELMRVQVEALSLAAGQHVADLGAGTGTLPLFLLEHFPDAETLWIDEVDYVSEALERARTRLARVDAARDMQVRYLECDLDPDGPAPPVPVDDGACDRVLASLVLNYVKEPARLLAEARRLLCPGGRLVLSTLRRDADISRIYRDVAAELHAGGALRALGERDEALVETELREFLNEAARLLDFEERGIFHFWDADELVQLLSDAGFTEIETTVAFGDPPQAIVASALRT